MQNTLAVFYGMIPHVENALKFRAADNPPVPEISEGLTDGYAVLLTDADGTVLVSV